MGTSPSPSRVLTPLLPGDDPAELKALLEELLNNFKPTDFTETRQVREMADAEWRLRRIRQFINIVLEDKINELAAAHPTLSPLQVQARAHLESESQLAFLLRLEEKHQRQYDRAFRDWTRYQSHKSVVGHREAQTQMDQFTLETEAMLKAHWAQRTAEQQNRTTEPNPPNPAPPSSVHTTPNGAPKSHARGA